MQNEDLIALNQIIEHYQKFFSDDQHLVIINLDFKIVYANASAAKMRALSPEECLSLDFVRSNNDSSEKTVQKRIENFEKAIKNKGTVHWLCINSSRSPEYQILITSCKPIINPATKNIIAFVMSASVPKHIPHLQIQSLIGQELALNHSIKINTQHNPLCLTSRELEIIFLLCSGFSIKQIAETVNNQPQNNLSYKTIYNIIRQQLFKKFDAHNISSLTQAAMDKEYHLHLPRTLLLDNVFPLD